MGDPSHPIAFQESAVLVLVNKPKPCPGFKYWLNVFLKKLNNFNSKNNYCYYCFSKQRQVIVDVKNTITAIVVA